MRPVKFDGIEKDLTSAIKESFRDILSGKEFVLRVWHIFIFHGWQIKDEAWGGVFVDMVADQDVEDSIQQQSPSSQCTCLRGIFLIMMHVIFQTRRNQVSNLF